MKRFHVRYVVLLALSLTALLSVSSFSFAVKEKSSDKPSHEVKRPANVKAFVDSQIRKGKVAYKKKDYQLALDEWNKAIEVDSHNREVEGLILVVKEKLQIGLPEKKEETVSVPTTVPAHKKKAYVASQFRLGEQAYRRKDYKSAYVELKKGLEVDPKNSEMKRLIGSVLEKEPNIEKDMAAEAEEAQAKKAAAEAEAAAKVAKRSESHQQTLASEEMTGEETPEKWESYQTMEQLPLDGTPLALEQCIMIARANSLSVKIAREEAALARWKMAPARRALWPSFDAYWKETRGTTTGQDFTGREMTLEFQKPLLTWGKTKALFLQSKVNWEIAKRNLQKEVTELDFKVEQAYFILANALQEAQDLKKLRESSQNDLNMAEKRYKLELARELEMMKVKNKVDEIDYRLQSSEKDLVLAQLTMSQILDSRNEGPFTVRAKLGSYQVETTLDQCVQLALKTRSDLLVNEMLIEYNKLGQKVARSEYKWNVNLEGSFGMNDEAFITETLKLNSEYFVGVKVTKPFGPHTIEDNFITQDKVPSVGQTTSTKFTSNTLKWYFWNSTAKINIKEADIKYLKAIDEYIKKRNSVIFEIKKNYYEYIKARQQLENNRQKIKVADEELKISVARLGLNEILDSELLESKDRLSRSKAEYGQSLTGYYTAVANLNKSIGLTDYFDLKRGLQEGLDGVEPETWRQYLNDPGEIGTLPNTEGYSETLRRLEGGKSWWQSWGGGSSAETQERKQPTTTKELVAQMASDGVDLYKQGKYEEALNKFQAAEQLDPKNEKVVSYVRKTKIKLGREVEDTGKHFSFAAKKSQSDEWTQKGLEAYRKKKYEEAVNSFNKALEIDPTDRRVQVHLERAKEKLLREQAEQSKNK